MQVEIFSLMGCDQEVSTRGVEEEFVYCHFRWLAQDLELGDLIRMCKFDENKNIVGKAHCNHVG